MVGVFKYRLEFKRLFDFDITKHSCTIASGVMAAFRSSYLTENTLLNITEYTDSIARKQQSTKGLKWLYYVQKCTGISIRTAAFSCGERRLGRLWLDATVEKHNTITHIIEFMGCLVSTMHTHVYSY